MIKIEQAVIVEGKHDKIKLENIISANIIATDGFRIYNNKENQALIRTLAAKTGVIILTDSDSAGRRIRNFVKCCAGGGEIINIYAPKVFGKEKRKGAPSKENILGVEGMDKEIILGLFMKLAAGTHGQSGRKITKADFYEDGLAGVAGSAGKRSYLCGRLGLPPMSANALVETANILVGFDEYKKIIGEYRE